MLISKADMSNYWQIYRVEIYFIFAGVWEVTFVNFDFKKTKKQISAMNFAGMICSLGVHAH